MKSIKELLLLAAHNRINISDKEWEIIEKIWVKKYFPKKTLVIEQGQVAEEMFFILTGLMRLFYLKDGEEITGYFFKEKMFANSIDSFYNQVSSVQCLEAIEDCEVLAISYKNWKLLFREVPSLNHFGRILTEKRLIETQKIISSYILCSPEERYLAFLKEHNDLFQRVPQHLIASYLGITPVSLSRIRKRLTRKD